MALPRLLVALDRRIGRPINREHLSGFRGPREDLDGR
jgi:hypothetical protein